MRVISISKLIRVPRLACDLSGAELMLGLMTRSRCGWNRYDPLYWLMIRLRKTTIKLPGALGSRRPVDRTGKPEISGTIFPTSQPVCQCIVDKVSPGVQLQLFVDPFTIGLHGFFA